MTDSCQTLLEIFRQWAFHNNFSSRKRMRNRQLTGMKHQPRRGCPATLRSIKVITQYRQPVFCEVHSDLMGAASLRRGFYPYPARMLFNDAKLVSARSPPEWTAPYLARFDFTESFPR